MAAPLAAATLIFAVAGASPVHAQGGSMISLSSTRGAIVSAGNTSITIQQGESRDARPSRVLSSQIELARDRARLQLELDDGRTLDFALRDGQAWAGDRALGPAPRGEAFDRAWRDLLDRAMDTPTDELPELLAGWTPPVSASPTRVALHREILAALYGGVTGVSVSTTTSGQRDDDASLDTVARLQQRIAELERRLDDDGAASVSTRRGRDARVTTTIDLGRRGDRWYSPLRHIGRGLAAILGDLVLLAVMVGIGFTIVYFARKPLEAIADTARNETLRSGLVGLAATFLVLPGYVLGIIALAISIVGIPLLIAWVPLFWVAVAIAAILGYLAVGHGIGEGLAERRFYGAEWARRANSYYYVLTGLAALFAPFIAGHAVQMAGPWLGFVKGILIFLGMVLTWAAVTIGFGAVLLTRAGTKPRPRPRSSPADLDMGDLFEEESHV